MDSQVTANFGGLKSDLSEGPRRTVPDACTAITVHGSTRSLRLPTSRHQLDRSGTSLFGSDAKNNTIQTHRRTTSLYKNSPVRFHAIGSVDTLHLTTPGVEKKNEYVIANVPIPIAQPTKRKCFRSQGGFDLRQRPPLISSGSHAVVLQERWAHRQRRRWPVPTGRSPLGSVPDAAVAQRELRGRYCLHGQGKRQLCDLIRRIVACIACCPMSHTR